MNNRLYFALWTWSLAASPTTTSPSPQTAMNGTIAHFLPGGTVITSMKTLDITLTMDLGKARAALLNMRTHLHKASSTTGLNARCVHRARRQTEDLLARTELWDTSQLPSTLESARPKRWLGAAISTGFAFLAGTAISLVTSVFHPSVDHRVDQLTRDLIATERAVKDLAAAQHTMISMMQSIAARTDRALHCNALEIALLSARQHINAITSGLATLVHANRLSPLLVSPADLLTAWPKINAAADNKAPPPAWTYEAPATFQTSHRAVHVTVHLPTEAHPHTIWRLSDFPLNTPTGPKTLDGTAPRIVALQTGTSGYRLFTEADLNTCPKFASTYLCPTSPERSDLTRTCTGALFTGNVQAAASTCPLITYRGPAAAIWLKNNRLAIYLPSEATVTTTCPTSTPVTSSWNSGFHSTTLPPGCSWRTSTLAVQAPAIKKVDLGTYTELLWPSTTEYTTNDLTNVANATAAKLNPVLKAISALPLTTTQTSALLIAMPTLTAGITIGAAGLCLLLLCRHYRTRSTSRRTRTSVSSSTAAAEA